MIHFVIIFILLIFWVCVLKFILNKIEKLEKENQELKLSNRELLDANYKLTKNE